MSKLPLLVEVIGDTGKGKTHTSLLFPNPVLVDLTITGESDLLVIKLFGKGWNKRYFRPKKWGELYVFLQDKVIDSFSTVIFDTSRDLVNLIGRKWCEEHGKKEVYPPQAWGQVYDDVDKILAYLLEKKEKNVVLTSGLKSEYIEGKRTRDKIRDGFTRLPGRCDVRLFVSIGDDNVRVWNVVKNRFVDETSSEYVKELKDFSFDRLVDITYRKIGLPDEVIVR